jgi:hypothetical protein
MAFVLFQATVFVVGTWIALGLRTRIWDPSYLLSIPLLLLHFAIFFSFSVLLAVCTRSPVVCGLGSIIFWFLCWSMNFGRHAILAALSQDPETSVAASVRWAAEFGYWILPKPADLGVILFDALGAEKFFVALSSIEMVRDQGYLFTLCSVATSLACMVFFLAATAQQFKAMDY